MLHFWYKKRNDVTLIIDPCHFGKNLATTFHLISKSLKMAILDLKTPKAGIVNGKQKCILNHQVHSFNQYIKSIYAVEVQCVREVYPLPI